MKPSRDNAKRTKTSNQGSLLPVPNSQEEKSDQTDSHLSSFFLSTKQQFACAEQRKNEILKLSNDF